MVNHLVQIRFYQNFIQSIKNDFYITYIIISRADHKSSSNKPKAPNGRISRKLESFERNPVGDLFEFKLIYLNLLDL